MPTSTITIDVHLDENKVPDKISWHATDSSAVAAQHAKAMMVVVAPVNLARIRSGCGRWPMSGFITTCRRCN